MKERQEILKATANSVLSEYLEILPAIIGGPTSRLTLKDIRPSGANFYVDYTDDELNFWNDAAKTTDVKHFDGTLIPAGCQFTGNQYADYGIDADTEKVSVSLTFTSTYAGAPADDMVLFSLITDAGVSPAVDLKDILTLKHATDGFLDAELRNTQGTLIARARAPFLSVIGDSTDILVTVDNSVAINAQAIKIFIDGMLIPLTSPSTGVKVVGFDMPLISQLMVGRSLLVDNIRDFTIGQIALFTDILYTQPFTPGAFPRTKYPTTVEYAILNSAISAKQIFGIIDYDKSGTVAFTTLVKTNPVSYTEKFWETLSGKWQNTTNSNLILETNTFNQLNNINWYHVYYQPTDYDFKILMQSADGYERPYFDSFEIKYEFYLTSIPTIHNTLIYGLINGITEKKQDFLVTAELNDKTVYDSKILLYPELKQTSTDDRGYWEILLPDTDAMTINSYYTITLNAGSGNEKSVMVTIPRVATIDIETLIKDYTFEEVVV